uniref:WxxW domain-containing protein n=1 Tax=Branchiostoma floridae TaxID=7739 RepID=C3YNH9_BRAFL|eukprot:XP_002602273.1 hypothetical protein BRAFLDRAFT_76960 [Branchiostoma floridae]
MAARLLLTVGLLFLAGRTAGTEVFSDDIASPAEGPQEARDAVADEVHKLENLVEMLQDDNLNVSQEVQDSIADDVNDVMSALEARGPPPVATGCAGWTRWYDRDNPSATGDWETLGNLRRENPGQICAAPSGIQARVKGSNRPASLAGERFFQFNPLQGIVCRNADQRDRSCQDYEVRFWCP